jgi:CHAT domain-containing protein
LILKAATISLTAFAVSALLLIAHPAVAFGQNAKEKDPASLLRAEEYFQESLTLCGTRERELARNRLLEAMRLWGQMREPEKAARAALQLGDCYKQARRYNESLDYYNLALKVSSAPGAAKAIAFNSMAAIYAEMYQRDLAAQYYDKAIQQARTSRDISTQALALTGLAHLYYQQGEKKRAIYCIRQARRLNRQEGNEAAEADVLHLLGLIDQEEGLMEQAKKAFEDALAIYRKTSDVERRVKILCSISNLYLLSAQRQPALEQAEQAVDMAEKQAERATSNTDKLRARELRWRAHLSLARAQRAVGQKDIAIRSYKRAIGHIEGMWLLVYISTETSAAAFSQQRQAPYMELIDMLIEQGKFQEAYEWAERAKGRALMGFIEARRTMEAPKKLDQDGRLRELSQSIARMRTQLLSSQLSPQQRAKLQTDIRDAELMMRETQLKAEMAQFRNRFVWSQPATIKQLQEKTLQDNDTILEYVLGENRSFAWIISSNEIFFEILPGRKEIEKEAGQYIKFITAAPNNLYIERDLSQLEKQAEKLSAILLGRLSEHILPGRRLIIVPDGLLHYLPFEALTHNGRYLLEDHEISYLPSASLSGLWQSSRKNTDTEDKMELLAFGDPIFGPELKASVTRKSRSGPVNIVRQTDSSDGFQLAPLPRTRDEVAYIAGLFSPDRSRIYFGKESTEEIVKQESLGRYRRLHFATHSLVDERSPSRSSVVLTLDDDPGEDGFLEVSEISELDLDCDLVVLSACQTGRGQLLSGEGILGLSRAFLYAGARSVVVSLWNVSDISTAQLMKTFYQHLVDKTSNAAALRQAKLKMARGGTETRHPYYWAPFIVVGEP